MAKSVNHRHPHRKSLNNCQNFYEHWRVDQGEFPSMLLYLERVLYGKVLEILRRLFPYSTTNR